VKEKLSSVAYITVGTGKFFFVAHTTIEQDVFSLFFFASKISHGRVFAVGVGVGLVINGKCVHGRMHPEGGHVPVQPLEGDSFPGYSWGDKSPFRGFRTVEGLASSVACTERLEQIRGVTNLPRSCLSELEDDDEVWDHAANAIANLCATLILISSIEKIVIGGGIMKRRGLLEMVQKRTVVLLNGYLELPEDLSQFITKSSYGDEVGLVGALVLAQEAHQNENSSDSQSSSTSILLSPFNIGLIHGIVVGAIVSYVGLVLARHRSK
jgi:hypothetical protein